MRLSCGNRVVDDVLFAKPQAILIYGREGAGKTNFVLSTLKISTYERAIYISTEGSGYVERAEQLSLLERSEILFAEALDTMHLINLVSSIPSIGKTDVLVIDSINFHYRAEAQGIEMVRQFLTLLALLKNYVACGTYIIAIAQVREVGEDLEPVGMQYLKPWADVIVEILPKGDTRVLRIEKPKILEARFRISSNGITWI